MSCNHPFIHVLIPYNAQVLFLFHLLRMFNAFTTMTVDLCKLIKEWLIKKKGGGGAPSSF